MRTSNEDEQEFVVDRFDGLRFVASTGKLEVKVHWQGYDSSEDTWEPATNFEANTIQEYFYELRACVQALVPRRRNKRLRPMRSESDDE